MTSPSRQLRLTLATAVAGIVAATALLAPAGAGAAGGTFDGGTGKCFFPRFGPALVITAPSLQFTNGYATPVLAQEWVKLVDLNGTDASGWFYVGGATASAGGAVNFPDYTLYVNSRSVWLRIQRHLEISYNGVMINYADSTTSSYNNWVDVYVGGDIGFMKARVGTSSYC